QHAAEEHPLDNRAIPLTSRLCCAGRACGAPLTLETSASPAGLTARARPEARPESARRTSDTDSREHIRCSGGMPDVICGFLYRPGHGLLIGRSIEFEDRREVLRWRSWRN